VHSLHVNLTYGPKYYYLHALANDIYYAWIREKTLEFSSVVLLTMFPFHMQKPAFSGEVETYWPHVLHDSNNKTYTPVTRCLDDKPLG